MRSICAWCQTIIHEDSDDRRETHGMCDRCICEMFSITPDELARQRSEWADEESRSKETDEGN